MFDSNWIMTIIFDPAGFAVDWAADGYTEDPTSGDPRVNLALPMWVGTSEVC